MFWFVLSVAAFVVPMRLAHAGLGSRRLYFVSALFAAAVGAQFLVSTPTATAHAHLMASGACAYVVSGSVVLRDYGAPIASVLWCGAYACAVGVFVYQPPTAPRDRAETAVL